MRNNACTRAFLSSIVKNWAAMVSVFSSRSVYVPQSQVFQKLMCFTLFRRMVSGDKRALKVFVDDVENTYEHLVNRVKINKEESQNESREQIQLVPENPDQTISFNVPDGPPPENLVLEGPGTEGLDIEEVRKALQFRWDVFQGFSPDLQEALKSGGLDGVNQVLGDLDVVEAESIVNSLDVAGILNFAEGGVRDQTGAE